MSQAEEIFLDEELEDEYINSRELIVEEDTFIYEYSKFIATELVKKLGYNITRNDIEEQIKTYNKYLDQVEDVTYETEKVLKEKFNINLKRGFDIKGRKGHTFEGMNLTKEIYGINTRKEIALKSGYYFMIFNKRDIPFFYELELVDYQVKKDNVTYDVYEANCWETAQKVDELLGNNFIGYDIDEYKVEKNFRI